VSGRLSGKVCVVTGTGGSMGRATRTQVGDTVHRTDSGMTAETDTRHRKAAAVADPKARKFLRRADPVLARVIDAHPDFHPRAWIDELPPFDAFGTLVFQVIGQQLSVSATRTILARLQERFGGHMPSPPELLKADPHELRASGMSTRKGATLRALAERFVDGGMGGEALARMTDDEIEAALTEVPGIGPWTAHRSLAVSYLFASEFEKGT
jgi:3-methyladenine DNA glycosylase/8-oxoguanine DNA glycosylase